MIIKRIFFAVFICAIIATTGGIFYSMYQNKINATNNAPQVFASSRMLLELWSRYKQNALEPGSLRTLDKSQNNITTSEGQSYTMLRAVWMDDMDTFEKSWQWTKDNLQRDDKLISWKFGPLGDGNYGIVTAEGGQNSATDADVDIALALLMAAGRWKEYKYEYDAQDLIKSIWKEEVVTINGKSILVANNLEKDNPSSVLVNPSYFAPYAYRIFAQADPSNNWNAVVDSSYDILFAASDSKLDTSSSSGLTPDWLRVSRETGEVIPSPEFTSNYGFEALRTPFRLALDWNWYQDSRAKQVLSKYETLYDDYTQNGKILATYSHDGKPKVSYETPAMYGAAQAYFDVMHPDEAKSYYTRVLLPYYSPDKQSWKNEMSYYDDNWVWFGLALHNGFLDNLTELIDE